MDERAVRTQRSRHGDHQRGATTSPTCEWGGARGACTSMASAMAVPPAADEPCQGDGGGALDAQCPRAPCGREDAAPLLLPQLEHTNCGRRRSIPPRRRARPLAHMNAAAGPAPTQPPFRGDEPPGRPSHKFLRKTVVAPHARMSARCHFIRTRLRNTARQVASTASSAARTTFSPLRWDAGGHGEASHAKVNDSTRKMTEACFSKSLGRFPWGTWPAPRLLNRC